MTEFTGFKPEHVGAKVCDILTKENGEIVGFTSIHSDTIVKFASGEEVEYSNGYYSNSEKIRRLYFGHNIKVKVTGEEVPEPKLICPVCGVEHGTDTGSISGHTYTYFTDKEELCPFQNSMFPDREYAIFSMQNLIKAMEK